MKSEAIHIGFDLDGVLIDHSKVKVDLAAQIGVAVPPMRTNAAFFADYFQKPAYRELQDRLYSDPIISLRAPLMAGALGTLDGLQEAGVRFTLVSRRREPIWAKRVLKHHGLWPTYFAEANTFFVLKPEEKNQVALRVGITHYIDDEVRILKHLLDVPNHFLMDPYSVFPPSDEYTTVRSHREFLNHVLKK
jgi:phosphoglycolate phosphatase-like HAD superfamily hydrolase